MSSTLQFGIKKIMYAYVKYVYEAPKNDQTVVSALSYSIKDYYQLDTRICCEICDLGSLTLGSI